MSYAIDQLGITAAHVLTFSQNVDSVAQQRLPRFAGKYSPEPLSGAMRMIRTSKKREMKNSEVRNGDTVITEQEWVRRALVPRFSDDADLYDVLQDNVLTSMTNPSSSMVKETVNARNRWIDRTFLTALLGPVIEQTGPSVTDIESIPFDSTKIIPMNYGGSTSAATNLHLGKLIKLRGLLARSDEDDVVLKRSDADGRKLYIAYAQEQLEYLLEYCRQISDSRFTDIKALFDGAVSEFLGMTWIPSELLLEFRDSEGNIPTVVWAEKSISGGPGKCEVVLDRRPDKKNALQVLNLASAGFVRMEDALVAVTYNGSAPTA